MTWLTARERAVAANQAAQIENEIPRLRRHLAAVSSRPGYDQFADERHGPPSAIAEHIKHEINGNINAATRFPVGSICRFSATVHNWMTGALVAGEGFERTSEDPSAACLINPETVGASDTELAMEAAAGIAALEELEEALQRVLTTGSATYLPIGFDPVVSHKWIGFHGVDLRPCSRSSC